MRLRTLLAILGILLTLLGLGQGASAAIINPGFENGFTGWDTIGNTSIQTAAFGSGPVEGLNQALLTTGTGAVSEGSLESFLGLPAGALDILVGDVFEGSAIQQTFTVNPGDVVQFAWNFLTNDELPFNDTAFFIINLFYTELADVGSPFVLSATDFFAETGFNVFTSGPLAGGSVTLALAIVDVGDATVDSGLLVDAVPEPATLALLGTGLVGLGAASWRRRRRQP